MYNTHEDLPTSVVDFVLTASGESDIKKVPLEDINNLRLILEIPGVSKKATIPFSKIPLIF